MYAILKKIGGSRKWIIIKSLRHGELKRMVGYPGEAYGLISDSYQEPETGTGFNFIADGSKNKYKPADGSAYYQGEEKVFQNCFLYLKDSRLYPNYP